MLATTAKNLFEGLWPGAPASLAVTSVVTDSRKAAPGCVFVAIKGERVDGHDFAAEALQRGAALVVAQHPVAEVPIDRTVLVADPLDAMIAMGANYRGRFNPLVLAVTGSVGKTTTKEYCGVIFSAFGDTLITEGNQNNEIGLPNTLFKLDDEVRYAVLEMGMQALGDIRKLSVAARPSGALITNIGTAHFEMLGSRKNILRAKMEVCEGLAAGSPLVLNADDELLWRVTPPAGVQLVYAGIDNPTDACEVRAVEIRTEDGGQRFVIQDSQFGDVETRIPAMGRHHVQNALMAYTAATRLGLNAAQTAAALARYQPTGMRQRIVEKSGVTVIEDCYNAGPDSMKAALALLRDIPVEGRRIAVLGDMLEMGAIAEEAHRALGGQVAAAGVDTLITVGALAALAAEEAKTLGAQTIVCTGNEAAARHLNSLARPGDAVLVKASRGMKFEEILDAFRPTGS